MAQMKEQINAPKTELSDEEITNLSDIEFKPLVITMLTEMVEYGCKMEEKVKAMQSEVKKIYREPTVKGRKLPFNSKSWSRRNKHSTGTE